MPLTYHREKERKTAQAINAHVHVKVCKLLWKCIFLHVVAERERGFSAD